MKCQICHTNDATIIFTQIINSEKIVLQICTECAGKKGISIEIEKPTKPNAASFIAGFTGITAEADDEKVSNLSCPVCGLTAAEFKTSGLFGCDKCPEAFGDYTSNLLKQIHGTDVYEGKKPVKLSVEGETMQELQKLRAELKRCIEIEDYERAVILRDQITELEGKNIKR